MNKETTLEKLQNAFSRLKEGQPKRISIKRKVTPSSVEDEAGLPKSTLRNTEAYNSLFKEIVEYKNLVKNRKQPDLYTNKKLSSMNQEVIDLKNKITELRGKVNKKEETINFLIAANAELTELLTEKITNSRLDEFLRSQETVIQIN